MSDGSTVTTEDETSSFANLALIGGVAWRVVALYIVLTHSGEATRKHRFYSGVFTAILAGLVSYGYLQPLFASVGMPLATCALNILTFATAAVGMCLGVLLPYPFPGACFGVSLSILISCFLPPFTILTLEHISALCIPLSIIFALLSIRFRITLLLFTNILVSGAALASILLPDMLSCLTAVASGRDFIPPNLGKDYDFNVVTINSQMHLGFAWIFFSILATLNIIYHQSGFLPQSTTTSATTTTTAAPRKKTANEPPPYLQPPPASPDAFNMFDPADLPPRLAEYANMVYSACEDLGNFFGFQDSSVRNQAEHLLILLSNNRRYMSSHILPPSAQPPSPIHALHAKVFSNYMKWCKAMGIPPNFAKMSSAVSAPPAVASRVVDLVLFFCTWGEACNVRHMPECLWFLYHKMMEEYILSEGFTQTRSLYAGHFVDHVITPIYDIVSKNMKSTKDHQDKRNYDDFNEFFWSRNCLHYQYCSVTTDDQFDLENAARGFHAALPGERLPPITEGLENAPKTFLEKRSWLRGIIALYRILEWHLVTFYLLAVVAFSRELVWGWVFTLQVASGVFWIFNVLAIIFGILEVWTVYPGIQLTGTAVCGSAFNLTARLLILVYQTSYLMWTFGPSTGQSQAYLGIEGDSNFWWWQYVWLSLLCMIPWFLDVLMQLYPALTTRLYTSRNDYFQSFLNIMFPLSRLYVGKAVHESFQHTAVYLFFWVTLMAWKLLFSYVFEVYSMVLPTLELTDDYMNYQDQSFTKMSFLLIMRWLPQFLVYLIDMSIWYAVWQALAGTAVGFSENLGDIRSMQDIRANFGMVPENFCRKLLSPDAGSRRGSNASFMLKSSSDNFGSEGQSLLGTDPHRLQSYVNRILDVRIQKWVMFSAVWNEIIDYFRQEDIISNRERDNLKFSRFEGFNQAIYLPVFQTAGVVDDILIELELPRDDTNTGLLTDEEIFKPILSHVIMRTAVSEVWELGSYVFMKLLGDVHQLDVVAVTGLVLKWTENGSLSRHMKVDKLRNAMKSFVQLVSLLEKGMAKRKPVPRPKQQTARAPVKSQAPAKGMRRVVSHTSLSMNNDKDPVVNNTASTEKVVIIDALRDQIRDSLRGVFNAIKGIIHSVSSDPESKDLVDRLTFLLCMEKGFLWNDTYASEQLDALCKDAIFKEVLTKIHGLVACHPDDVEPKSKEAKRRLTFFVNSLFMDMPYAPSIHDMFSWNVLTPYYSEDVTYTKGDLETRSDALGVSTLLYLQTLYRSDWNNFLERLSIQDDDKIWSKKYIQETRNWASIRAQTLTRTVNGMMYYEKALRLLGNLERLDDDTTNDLMGEKFGYVVACQVYGNMKKNQDSKAEDIDQLMHRFPHLRVAYIDTIRLNRAGADINYSVLVKSDGKGGIQEIYRVRLPGNPVLGEGKPENQNHAMIFTRGEFVQTIDMNQEGYFEEALKMRNALQEFAKREGPLPTTILGLREHIFTGSVSSLSNYMALQETSFVTLGQRVLAKPLRIRLHYGHPDVFDKLFFITRGGISKSSKGINLSEDIFAGYNNAIRGGQVGFKEYLQVGKGRDVGMSQIYKFEAKLSQGAGEQSLSRDVYRLCHRLDFCRLLSFYFGGIGHYFSNVLTVLTIYCVVYLMAVLAIFDLEKIGDRTITPMGTIQMMLGGLGLLQTIPLFATLGVERGWWNSFREIVHVFITGGPLHFMFHIQTKAYYMSQTLLVGGAQYRATGRGFVTQHTPMAEQFRFFASSHLYLGVELAAGLIVMGIFSEAKQYFGRTWSLWLASLSFLASPFWFNPLSFEWNVVVNDYHDFLDWITGTTGGSLKSWSMWWTEENSYYKKMTMSSKLLFVGKSILYLLVANGIRTSNLFQSNPTLDKPWISVGRMLSMSAIMLICFIMFQSSHRTLPYPLRRTLGIIITLLLTVSIVIIFIEDSDCIRYTLAGYYAIGALCQLGLLVGIKATKHFYFIHDFICGHIIFIPLFILAGLQLPHHIQTWLLYHNALSTDVVVSDILRYARKSQEHGAIEQDEDLIEQVAELRKLVQKQEQLLLSAGLIDSALASMPRNDSSSGLVNVIEPSREQVTIRPNAPLSGNVGNTMGRVHSMSGFDVWGAMTLGDQPESNSGNLGGGYQSSYGGAAPSRQQPRSQPKASDFIFSQPDALPPR